MLVKFILLSPADSLLVAGRGCRDTIVSQSVGRPLQTKILNALSFSFILRHDWHPENES